MMILVLSQVLVCLDKNLDASNPISIVRDQIMPRIARAIASMERDRSLVPQHRLNRSTLEEYERRVAHIELMIHFVGSKTASRLTPDSGHQSPDGKSKHMNALLRDYREATHDMPEDRDDADVFINALEKAVRRVHNLPEPDTEKAQLSDVFSVRNIYDDPEIKALINSDRFTREKRLELQEAVEDLLLQQPVFPPECYALLRA
ncbi:hypothetical protein FRC01_000796 [Tulasnella sp. 417]|nr:hypothetical protein FRC01_000796 [Tulasnella sp. 417]